MSWDFVTSARVKKTRKDHKCVCCGRTIPAGSTNIYNFSGMFEGEFSNNHECNWCENNRQIFIDDGYYCDFWDGLREYFCELFEKYKECDCADKHGLAGNIETKLSGDYLIFYCEHCGKEWHREYMPISKGVTT